MSFSAIIHIPSEPTLLRILATHEGKNARSTTTISPSGNNISITITATDFTSLRASTNSVMQTIAVHNNITGA